MLKFSLEDLNETGLKKIANLYKIDMPKTKPLEEVVNQLNERIPSKLEISLGDPKRKWYKTSTGLFSLISLFISFSGWVSVYYIVDRASAQSIDDKRLAWKQVTVYNIIKEKTKEYPHTIAHADILADYRSKVQAEKDFRLTKDDQQETEFNKILISLVCLQAIYVNTDDRYGLIRSSQNPQASRYEIIESMKLQIFDELDANSGKYSMDELSKAISGKSKATSAEISRAINEYLMQGAIVICLDGKLFTFAKAPRKNPE